MFLFASSLVVRVPAAEPPIAGLHAVGGVAPKRRAGVWDDL